MIHLAKDRGWQINPEATPARAPAEPVTKDGAATKPEAAPVAAEAREKRQRWFARWLRRSPQTVEGE